MDKIRGIRIRGHSIQIDFHYKGVRCRETLKIPPTKPNLKFADRKRSAILHEIAIGTFDYSGHFPGSINAVRFGFTSSLPTISDALYRYVDSLSGVKEFSTVKDYRSALRAHLIPAFGNYRLDELTTQDIRDWIATLDISNKRINNVLVPIRGLFADCFQNGKIDRNPFDRIKNLPIVRSEPHPFDLTEITKILDCCPTLFERALYTTAFFTGLRTSELISLDWSCIDCARNVIIVDRAIVLGHRKTTKTKSGIREVDILSPVLNVLIELNDNSTDLPTSGRIFLNPRTAQPWSCDGQIRKTSWIPVLRMAGIAYRVPYQTRHTFASLMLSAGENPLYVATQMGHKDWGMIRKTYGRWIKSENECNSSKIQVLLDKSGTKLSQGYSK